MEDNRNLWNVELEILDEFDKVCTSNNLRYSLAFGTLLGAVRHKGFIPWDDDIDILMPRNDYNRLIKIWKSDEYILQTPYNTKELEFTFSKIRKNHTTFLEYEDEKRKKYHKGIFIDIFPLDRVAPFPFMPFQYLACLFAMLYKRGYAHSNRGAIAFIEKNLLRIISSKCYYTIYRKMERKIKIWNNETNQPYFGFQTIADMKRKYRPDVFNSLILLEFEGKKYKAFKNYDEVLKNEFGNYMKLPPIEERVWKHVHYLVNYEKNFEDLSIEEKLN